MSVYSLTKDVVFNGKVQKMVTDAGLPLGTKLPVGEE